MKKIYIVLIVVAVTVGGYFSYTYLVDKQPADLWSFVPSDAALILQGKLIEEYNNLTKQPSWDNLSRVFPALTSSVDFLDTLSDASFEKDFTYLEGAISIHKVSSKNSGYLFYLDIQDVEQSTLLNTILSKLKVGAGTTRSRSYNGFEIQEVSNQQRLFTYFLHKNLLIGSFTPYLVEDAIRTYQGTSAAFRDQYDEITGHDGETRLYIGFEAANELQKTIFTQDVPFSLQSGAYKLEMDSAYFRFSGTSYPASDAADFLSSPGGFTMTEVIPDNTASITHYSFSSLETWKHNQENTLTSTVLSYRDSLIRTYDFDVSLTFDLIQEEFAMLHLESDREDEEQKFMILKVRDTGEALTFFRRASERVAYSRGDSLYSESYSENEIRFFPIKEFPMALLGSFAEGFYNCFYLNYRNYIIFSNDIHQLRGLVEAIEQESVWGKSLEVRNFIDNIGQTSNITYIAHLPRSWASIRSNMKTAWQEFVTLSNFQVDWFEYAALKLTSTETGEIFTQLTVSQEERAERSNRINGADRNILFGNKLITKPYLVRTHTYRDFDLIVQDNLNTVYYLDKDLNTLWSVKADGPIIGKIHAIDYYKNNKYQYAFITEDKVYMVDRTGNPIPDYPKGIDPAITMNHFNLIDYDRSKNYRLSVTDHLGQVYLTDKNLKPLEGWAPKVFEQPAVRALNHYRIGRRDIMLSIQENGVINLTNRRGQNMPGFPYDLNESIDDSYFLKQSNDLNSSTLSVITKGGQLVKLSLTGKLVDTQQLIKSSQGTTFNLVPDVLDKSFIVVRHEGNTYEVLDARGQAMFVKDYLSNAPVLFQYYKFGAGRDLIALIDTANHSLYLYDDQGNLKTGNPIRAANLISIMYSSASENFKVYTTWEQNLEVYSFDF